MAPGEEEKRAGLLKIVSDLPPHYVHPAVEALLVSMASSISRLDKEVSQLRGTVISLKEVIPEAPIATSSAESLQAAVQEAPKDAQAEEEVLVSEQAAFGRSKAGVSDSPEKVH